MLSLTQSLTALEESSFFLSLGLVCDELGKLILMGVVLPVFAVDTQDTFIPTDGKNSKMLLRTTL